MEKLPLLHTNKLATSMTRLTADDKRELRRFCSRKHRQITHRAYLKGALSAVCSPTVTWAFTFKPSDPNHSH